jgi:hypothetical protein
MHHQPSNTSNGECFFSTIAPNVLTHSICCPNHSIELSNSISALNEGLGFMHHQPSNTSNGECFFSTIAPNVLENTQLWSFENCKIGEKNWGY